MKTAGLFTVLVIVLALSGKFIGGFIGTKIIVFDHYDSLIFGIGVMLRAGVELVVLMVAVSILVSPTLLKFAIEFKEKSKAQLTRN